MTTRKENRGKPQGLGLVETLRITPEKNRAKALARLQERPDIVEAINFLLERLKPEWFVDAEVYLDWDPWTVEHFPDEGFVEFTLFGKDGSDGVRGASRRRIYPELAEILRECFDHAPPSVARDLGVFL